MGFRFVAPSTERLDLGDGDWLEVKRELSVGETKHLQTSGIKHIAGNDSGEDVKLGIDWRVFSIARVLAWVMDWNSKDAQGKPVKFCREAIEQLAPEDFDRIETALTAHIEAVNAAKKSKAAPIASGAI